VILKHTARGLAALAFFALSTTASWAMKIDIVVNKVTQHMIVTIDGVQKYDWLVSTGGEGHDTPSGNYHVFRLEAEHFSQEWDNAPMPHSMFFTGMGHAIHGSYHINRLGTRASHGCVRLAPENATLLFDLVSKAGYKNSSVVIKGGFFDFTGNQTVSNEPHKPFFWWEKKPVQKKVAEVVKNPSKKKKKFKGLSLFGGQEG
jgi:L,D-transpeptidase catalytic domain